MNQDDVKDLEVIRDALNRIIDRNKTDWPDESEKEQEFGLPAEFHGYTEFFAAKDLRGVVLNEWYLQGDNESDEEYLNRVSAAVAQRDTVEP